LVESAQSEEEERAEEKCTICDWMMDVMMFNGSWDWDMKKLKYHHHLTGNFMGFAFTMKLNILKNNNVIF
jgi:hypothetical protein